MLKIVRDSHVQALHQEVDKSLPLSEVKALTGPSLPLLLVWPKTGVAMVFVRPEFGLNIS